MKIYKLAIFLCLTIGFFWAITTTHGVENTFDSHFFSIENIEDLENQIDTLEAKLARLEATQNGVIVEPIRQGFPYCEPFTGNILERVNTRVGGSATLTAAPGQNNGVLQLTNTNSSGQLGYSFIDFPFSSTYGIKVSFEYFIYNPTDPTQPGDGISFFLYDGNITAPNFRIGGLGGSLGYSAHGFSGGGFTDYTAAPPLFSPENTNGFGGLLGGYLGIGFDVWGKFGNEFERRYGGFLRPNDYWATHPGVTQPRYPNSVIVRGPQIIQPGEERRNGMTYPSTGLSTAPFNSYGFVTGKVTNDDSSTLPDVILGTGSLPKNSDYFVSPMFNLSSGGRVEDCSLIGYRKVFIDFKPINPLDPSAGYLIDVDMLVNNGGSTPQLIQVLNTFFNPDQPVPTTFKLGFAGATGSKQAFQEIRNVTIQVSNENQLTKPETNELNASACVGDEEFFELAVDLNNIGAQIQCVQLYETEAEALAVQNQLNQITNVQDCNSGICQIEVCRQERLIEETALGFFEAAIFLENGKEVPKIKFKSKGNVFGTTTIWYTVTDNFGQISAPKKINIVINPTPKIDSSGTIIGPTCNGQNDGNISNVIINDLIPSYNFTWKDQNENVIPASNYTVSETIVNGYIQATIGVNGINLGDYFLTVNNPATNSACDDEFRFSVNDVRGTPVEVVLDDQQICEGTPVTFTPELEDPTDAANPNFVWWKDNEKTKPITDGLTEGAVNYEISGAGILTITGLPQSPTPLEYFVEVEADPSQNLCATPSGQLKRVQVLVLPPLSLSTSATDDLCREGVGSISVNATGGFGTYTYSLNGGPPQNSNIFNGLLPDTYTIEVASGANCIGTITEEVIGSPELLLSIDRVIQPACGESNGLMEVSFSGGTPGYTLEFVKNGTIVETLTSPTSPKVYQNLSPGNYEIRIKDANSCNETLAQALINDVGLPITVAPMLDEICYGDVANITPVVTTTGSAELKWYKDEAANQEIVSSTSPDANGFVFNINSSTQELTVSGLTSGVYKFYLVANGPGYCPNPPFVASISVFEPITADLISTNEICFGASDGTITVNAAGADGNFEYSLSGGPFVANKVFSGIAPGTYTVDIRSTGPNGCTFQTTTTVDGPPSAISINNPTLIRSSCDLENGGIEDLQISGGWGNYQIEWRKGSVTGPVIPGTMNGAADLGPDTYYLLISDQGGCTEEFSFIIEASSDPVYALIDPINACFGEPVTIRPIHIAPDPTLPPTAFTEVRWYKDAGQTGLISNGPDPQDPAVNYTIDDSDWLNPQLLIENLPAGTHDFYFYVECTGQEIKAEVTVYEIPEVLFDSAPVICFGDANGKILIESGSLPAYQYSVNGANPISQSELEALSFAAGTYSIEVTTPAGCPQQIETVIIESPSEALAISPITQIDPGCGANNGRLEGVISGGWMPYTVTLTQNGAILDTFTSTDGILSVTDLSKAIYQFEIQDAQGCQVVSDPVDLVDGPTQILVDDQEICAGQEVVLTPVLDPVAPGATYQWTFDAAGNIPIISGSTVAGVTYQIGTNGEMNISGLPSSNSGYSYYLTASGVGVCPGFIAKADVRVFDSPTATVVVENEICFGEGGQIVINSSGGSGTYTYSLNGQPEQTSNVFIVPTGTYSVIVNTPQGCFVELKDILVTGPAAALEVSNLNQVNPSCEQANGSVSFTVAGGYGNYSVDVIKDGVKSGTVLADANGVVSINAIGSGTYQFEISDSEGCILILNDPLDLIDVPTEVNANDQSICEGETAQILPSVLSTIQNPVFTWYFDANENQPIQSGSVDGVTYAVESNGQLSISGLPAIPTPYTYYVMVSGPGICGVVPKPVNVNVFSIPTLRVSNPSIVCDPEGTVDLTKFIEGFNPTLYDYDVVSPNGSQLKLDQLGAVNLTGDYRVSSSMKSADCWNQPQRIRVIISDSLLVANFQYTADLGDGTIGINDKIQIFDPVQFQDLTVGRAISWNWDFGDGSGSSSQNPSHIYTEKGTYTVILSTIDQFGCESEFVMQVVVTDEFKVMVPNAFTPEGQKNQYFKPIHRGIASINFYVFNTWGELIYHSDDLEDIGWDGTLKGQNVPNGNYVYKVIFITRSGEKIEQSGVFLLIR